MALLGQEFRDLKDVLVDQLEDLYDAEKRIVDALPDMEKVASTPELKEAFREHLEVTKQQVSRLDEIFRLINHKPGWKTCEGMKGLIEEGEEIGSAKGDGPARDAGLIAAAQKVEHYEIAGYGTARTLAQQLGFVDIASLCQTTLDEEKETDRKLTEIAERFVNVMAVH